MMQQVDLLVPELRPRREHLTLRQLGVIWGGFVLVLLVMSSWEGIRAWRLASTQAEMEVQFRELSQTNDELRSSFATTPEPELITEVEELRDRFRNQALLVNAVERYEHASSGGFSRYLHDLAARHVEGMALSRIELTDGGEHILLSGETNAPVNVPLFLKRLSEGESFRGHRFDEFRVEAQESGYLKFDIVGPDRERQG
jgi:hypothetical protein